MSEQSRAAGWSHAVCSWGRSLRPVLIVLWLGVIAYASYFSVLSIRQHDGFLTHRDDLGRFDQPIWNTLQGRPFLRTEAGLQLSRFTDHVEPILVPISLIYLLWDDVRALLILQAVAVALGVFPVFWLTRDELKAAGYSRPVSEAVGLVLACAYLLFPALEAANLTEFHAAPLMVAPMLMAIYTAHGRRYGWMWPAVLAAAHVSRCVPPGSLPWWTVKQALTRRRVLAAGRVWTSARRAPFSP